MQTIKDLEEYILQHEGQYGLRRLHRAMDEIPNLEHMFGLQGLKAVFSGDNAKAAMTMNPADFEKYASPIPEGARHWSNSRASKPDKTNMSTADYVRHLGTVGPFESVPYLEINKEEAGLPITPTISGHEGRHRNRALSNAGKQASLVLLNPRSELREPFPRRSRDEYLGSLKNELDMTHNMVMPQKYSVPDENGWSDIPVRRPAIKLPDVYADGGSTTDIDAMKLALMNKGGTMPQHERDANLEKFLKDSAVKDRLYHGTKKDIKQFDSKTIGANDFGWYGRGHYLTADPGTASAYVNYDDILATGKLQSGAGHGANVMPLHVQARNPYYWPEGRKAATTKEESEALTKELLNLGHDSVIVGSKYQDPQYAKHHEVVLFDPRKIKSATGNRGTYDPTKPDITMKRGGTIKDHITITERPL